MQWMIAINQLRHARFTRPNEGVLFILRGQHLGAFAVEIQDQDAGLSRPFFAGVLADAIDKTQAACFELGLQFMLPLFVLFRAQPLAEWVPCRDEGSAVGVLCTHQACEFGARLPDAHFEGGVSVDEVIRLFVRLDEFGGNAAMHVDNFTQPN